MGDAGGIVAIAEGLYTENIQLGDEHHGITVTGRCPEMVTFDGSAGSIDWDGGAYAGGATLEVIGASDAEWFIAGVAITGSSMAGAYHEGGTLTLDEVQITENPAVGLVSLRGDVDLSNSRLERNQGGGLVSLYGTVTLKDSDVRDTQGDSGGYGPGIFLGEAQLTATGCTIEGNRSIGVHLSRSAATLERCEILDTQSDANGWDGSGCSVWEGSSLTLIDSTVQDNHYAGVAAYDSTVTLKRSEVLDTWPEDVGTHGGGVSLIEGSDLICIDSTLTNNHFTSLYLYGSTATLDGCEVRDTWPDDTGEGGVGVGVISGSVITITDSIIDGNHSHGVFIEGSDATIERSSVSQTQSNEAGGGRGISVQDSATLSLIDSEVAENHEIGLAIIAGSATVVGTTVRDTQPTASGIMGRGINVQEGSDLQVSESTISGNHDIGVFIGDATATLTDCAITGTQPNSTGNGRGISLMPGSELVMRDCLVEENYEIGILVEESIATLDGVQVLGTRRGAVATAALGLVAQIGSEVSISDSELCDTAGPGLLTTRSTVTCSGCTLAGNALAAAIVLEGNLDITDSTLSGTVPMEGVGGVGLLSSDKWGESTLSVSGSTIADNALAGAYLKGPGEYSLIGNLVSGGNGDDTVTGSWSHGDGVFVTWGEFGAPTSDQLHIADNVFADNAGAAIFLNAANATLNGNTYEGNATDLVRQGCAETSSPDGIDTEPLSTTELCPTYDYITEDVTYTVYIQDIKATD